MFAISLSLFLESGDIIHTSYNSAILKGCSVTFSVFRVERHRHPFQNISVVEKGTCSLPRSHHPPISPQTPPPSSLGNHWFTICQCKLVCIWYFLLYELLLKIFIGRVPVITHRKRIWPGTMRFQVPSLAWLSRLKIWCCRELWCRSPTWLGFHIAVAVV